jgi:hypothetical protein
VYDVQVHGLECICSYVQAHGPEGVCTRMRYTCTDDVLGYGKGLLCYFSGEKYILGLF